MNRGTTVALLLHNCARLEGEMEQEIEDGQAWGRWRYKKATEVLELMDEFRDLEFELNYVDKDSRTGVGFLVWLMVKKDQVSRQDLFDLARALVTLRTPVLP